MIRATSGAAGADPTLEDEDSFAQADRRSP
jgi:hypothetical protein